MAHTLEAPYKVVHKHLQICFYQIDGLIRVNCIASLTLDLRCVVKDRIQPLEYI